MLRHIPNTLCVLRMLLVVPVAWLLVHDEFGATLWVFGFAAATDGFAVDFTGAADGCMSSRGVVSAIRSCCFDWSER